MNIAFKGKVVMITGGTKGIGLKCAEYFADGGAKVAIAGIDNIAEATEIVQRKGDVKGYYLDVINVPSIADVVQDIRKSVGEIDILVCSAGINLKGPKLAEDVTLEEWDNIYNINVRGTFFCNQAVAKQSMIPRKTGVIINLSSQAGLMVGTGRALPYGTSKAAIIHLTRVEAIEWAIHNIRVVAVAPTFTMTDLIRHRFENNPELLERETNSIPLHRFATVEDIANSISFLASNAASMITGVTLPVDGGRTSL